MPHAISLLGGALSEGIFLLPDDTSPDTIRPWIWANNGEQMKGRNIEINELCAQMSITFQKRLSEASGETEEAADYGWSASKTASKRDERNGTERDGRRRITLSIHDKLGSTERAGTEWNRAPMFRKQQIVTSTSLFPTCKSRRLSPEIGVPLSHMSTAQRDDIYLALSVLLVWSNSLIP